MSKEQRALNRIADFMSKNAIHWKQDIVILQEAINKLNERETNSVAHFHARTHEETQKLIEDLKKNKVIIISNAEDNKKIKALEIIKKKRVSTLYLFKAWEEENNILGKEYKNGLEKYNTYHYIKLTQEEYDLLKEVLL